MPDFSDKNYWETQYQKLIDNHKATETSIAPSPFAKFLVENNYIRGDLIELGCGSGRDSIYFAQHGATVTAVDQCESLNNLLSCIPSLTWRCADFTRLPPSWNKSYTVIYSRFTMHSIDESGEDRALNWAFQSLQKDGHFCIEARSTKDPLCGIGENHGRNIWFQNKHHRRFIEATEFVSKLNMLGFETVLFNECNGLAPYKTEDPVVLRLILKKP